MAFVRPDDVWVVATAASGLGNISCAGTTPDGFSAPVDHMVNGDTSFFKVYDPVTFEWERFLGTYVASSNSIARTTFKKSSSGSPINFTAGPKWVTITPTYEDIALVDDIAAVVLTTGAANILTWLSQNGIQNVASATPNIGAATAEEIAITGTTTITAFDTVAAGIKRFAKFTGILTLTHSANIIIPGEKSITTAAGDCMFLESEGGGVWRVHFYQFKDGSSLSVGQATIASATSTDLGGDIASSITVSGVATITGFASTARVGTIKHVTFSGVLLLTHNATSLIIPGGKSITTFAGLSIIVKHESSGNWRVLNTGNLLSNPLIVDMTEQVYAPSAGSAFTVDWANGGIQHFTSNANLTITLPSAAIGKSGLIRITYGGTHTLTFAGGTALDYPNNVAPTPTSTNNKYDVYGIVCFDAAGTTVIQSGSNFPV